jgi:hypothetical protein
MRFGDFFWFVISPRSLAKAAEKRVLLAMDPIMPCFTVAVAIHREMKKNPLSFSLRLPCRFQSLNEGKPATV